MIYEYECLQCGNTVEEQRKVADRDSNLPICHGPMSRKISKSGFVLKGDGWYKDGYQKKG